MFHDLTVLNKEELRAYLYSIIEAVPDRHFDVTRIVATEKGAIVECVNRGKHTGKLMGIPLN